MCIAADHTVQNENLCEHRIYREIVLIDSEVKRGDKLADLQTDNGINDLQFGVDLVMTHQIN